MHRFNKTLLAVVVVGMVTLPLFAHDGAHITNDTIWIDEGLYRSYLEGGRLSLFDYSGTDSVELRSNVLTFYSDNGGITVSAAGVTFADGTLQQSAAVSTEAWPMVCKTTVDQGILPSNLSYATLFCRSPQSGVPGGDIGSAVGVPSGYFFVVTDVLANCGLGPNCNGVFFRVTRRNIIASNTDIETWVFPVSDTTSAGEKLLSLQFSGPLMILEPGDYLVGLASGSQTGGHTVFAQVMGYLTANPERFGR